jgi:hypothetical protein
MNRRELIILLGGAMTAGRALYAQQKAMPASSISRRLARLHRLSPRSTRD